MGVALNFLPENSQFPKNIPVHCTLPVQGACILPHRYLKRFSGKILLINKLIVTVVPLTTPVKTFLVLEEICIMIPG